ncbi:hypothetical protein RRV45_21805 [Bacillus sp. DTU_2020_1000418_1_SI_GHA_SEK_038]|uniref:hypothetical protein n=1 Tax=Bacillus sp. DTU_2020_1000418_1_SI_GHA_SEK_038 TaxID=3077585 RepID=UPI0028F0D0EF|nr:hypothetical protein [Bacillus sp. DTU_2020_1000418_1_SI_GHA_SEK_038]WNS75468.1 hypothetical protein RRV45_21805 [Bacillus sp. DTU_2020_1000418_1_SI_GHA_SEK_038]
MDTVIYLLLTIAYLFLFVLGILLTKGHSWTDIGNVLLMVILALLYDNGILALGKYIGEGDLLRSLNLARYYLHALITPLLVLFAWYTLVKANIKWTKKSIVQWLAVLLTICLIIVEFVTVVRGISLVPAMKYGVLGYKNVGAGEGPPIMVIGVSIVLVITSIMIWIKQKWPWYFIGTLIMGLAPMIHLKTDALHNIAEFVLMLALLATKAYQDKKKYR